MAAGTLPIESFRFYVEQNLMYLLEYARAMAIAASKAGDEATMKQHEAMGFQRGWAQVAEQLAILAEAERRQGPRS